MEKKITVANLMTANEKKAAKRKAKRVEFINKMLSVMEEGKEYRCKELARMMKAQGFKRGTSFQNIARVMRTLFELGLVVRTTKDGEPRTFEDYRPKKIVLDGETYYSKNWYNQNITVIPKIAYYSLA